MPERLKRTGLWPFARSQSTAKPQAGVDGDALVARELAAIEARFPELAAYFKNATLQPGERRGILFELIAKHYPSACEAAWRSQLRRIGTEAAEREIAESDLREGIPYSSNVQKFPDIWARALPAVRAHEEAYGAAVFTVKWPSYSRGRALAYYFEHHPPQGRVLHIAPEKELEQWCRGRAATKGFSYQTVGLGPNTDRAEDLTAMDFADNSYDLIICHRVLEHIFDESRALAEVRRVLRPGGCFNVSVPESMQLSTTLDWCYPDRSHHQHYRQYGADFLSRLNAAGFRADCVDWLLRQSPEQLQSAGVYPMRLYNAFKA
jgi:hypothetical protein